MKQLRRSVDRDDRLGGLSMSDIVGFSLVITLSDTLSRSKSQPLDTGGRRLVSSESVSERRQGDLG